MYRITGRKLYLERAYSAYQQAVDRNSHCGDVWISVGLLYSFIDQRLECLECFAMSIRLNPYVPLVWRNLGLLVSSNVYESGRTMKLISIFSMIQMVNIQMLWLLTRE